jgi:hypothetical protein
MNSGPLLYFGLVATLAASWFGFVVAPHQQLGALQPDTSTNGVGAPR